jgi:3'(2'), 5'-bisphosphate nucleotidase
MTNIGGELSVVCEAAATVILPLWRTGVAVTRKTDDSPVTEADRRGEALILAELAKRWPDTPVIAEEFASEFGTPQAIARRFFLVDPIDGTKAFVRGDPHFTVNIALIEDGRPAAGAVASPATGEVWFTAAGGAFKRRPGHGAERIGVRPWPQGDALALVSHTMNDATARELGAAYGFARHARLDSSIKFCRIAEGAADIYPRHGATMEWDVAAGHAVLEAAGGRVTQPDGEPFLYGKAAKRFLNGWFVARGG